MQRGLGAWRVMAALAVVGIVAGGGVSAARSAPMSRVPNAAPALPLPTAPQLAYQQDEIMALIHFNMATFFRNGDPACDASNWGQSQHPSSFWPTELDTDNWVESFQALGAKEAVLTAKHGCGFCIWPTEAKLPNGTRYPYSIAGPGGFGVDVLKQFQQSCEKAGIGHGFYYSLTNNFFLNVLHHNVSNTKIIPGQVKVTQAEFEAIALAQVTELWSNYGNLTEIWFDGGYTTDMKSELTKLLLAKQPQAVAFNGLGVSPNPIRWIGTETGMPAGPIWSTGTSGLGDPDSPVWNPAGCDTTLQDYDTWFYVPGTPLRSLATLIQVYHDTVGNNGVLEMDFAIDRTGRVDSQMADAYKEFGDWIRSCYGSPVAQTSGNKTVVELGPFPDSSIDRFIIREDQSLGQRIRTYSIDVQMASTPSGSWVPFSSGTSVGNKRIDLGSGKAFANVTAARLTVTTADDTTPHVTMFAAVAPCAST